MINYYLIFLVSVFLTYVFFKLTRGISRSSTCLLGKTAIVTGANSGIGYNTVLNLASRGCRIIMADVADMEESKRNVIKYTNNSNIITKHIDLSSLQSVRDFASDIVKTENRLDILVNNAGIGTSKEELTRDGLHPVMQVNYFGHFLLTHLLIDLLKKSAPSRIVFTSSFLAFFNNLNVDNLGNYGKIGNLYSRALVYGNSKYALLLASDIFAAKLKKDGVISNSVNPGFTASGMLPKFWTTHRNPLIEFIVYVAQYLYEKSPWEGAQTLIHVATSKKMEDVTGKYFWDCKPFVKPYGASNGNFCRDIWTVSEKYVGLKPEEKL